MLPPLMESPSAYCNEQKTKPAAAESSLAYVPCFSNLITNISSSSHILSNPTIPPSSSSSVPLFSSSHYNSQFPSPNFGQYNDNSLLLRALMERQAGGGGAGAGSLNLMKQNFSVSEMNTEITPSVTGPVDLDCIWDTETIEIKASLEVINII
ncbi:hypothetical protein LINPERHAP2_LOCUS37604 [Linum perenne]